MHLQHVSLSALFQKQVRDFALSDVSNVSILYNDKSTRKASWRTRLLRYSQHEKMQVIFPQRVQTEYLPTSFSVENSILQWAGTIDPSAALHTQHLNRLIGLFVVSHTQYSKMAFLFFKMLTINPAKLVTALSRGKRQKHEGQTWRNPKPVDI